MRLLHEIAPVLAGRFLLNFAYLKMTRSLQNTERRRRMMKTKRGVCAGIVFFLLFICGCGQQNGRSGDNLEIKNGDTIARQLTEDVSMNAVVQIPEAGLDSVERCTVRNQWFNGKEMAERAFPQIPESEWDYPDNTGQGISSSALYEGNLNIKEGGEAVPGMIYLGPGINISTDRSQAARNCFKHAILGIRISDIHSQKEFAFASIEEAAEEVDHYWQEITGLEGAAFFCAFSVSHEAILEEQEIMLKIEEEVGADYPIDIYEWDETDDCYDIRMELLVNGIPLTADPMLREDGIYVPSGEIRAIYTSDGIVNLSYALGSYEILKKDSVDLVSMDVLFEALEKKFSMMITGKTEIDRMQMVYYPIPLSPDLEVREYDLVPVWRFWFKTGEMMNCFYINAITGEEIVS